MNLDIAELYCKESFFMPPNECIYLFVEKTNNIHGLSLHKAACVWPIQIKYN